MPITFHELAGSPIETYGPDGLKAQRVLLCAWDDRAQLAEQLLGDGYEFGGRSRAQYPASPDVVAMRVRCEPLTDDVALQSLRELTAGLNRYNGFAKVSVDYELLLPRERPDLPPIEPGTFVTYRQDLSGELLALSARGWKWKDAPTVAVSPEDTPSLRLPILEHHCTWHRVVRPPWQAIRTCSGTVNSATFLGAAARSVLLAGAAAEPEFLRIDGLARAELGWRIRYLFRERAVKTPSGSIVGFNHAYRSLPADNPAWDELLDTHDNPLYRSSDFAQLFRFEVAGP